MNKLKDTWEKAKTEFVPLFVITAAILLFTFPVIFPDYGPGIDPSYQWGLNWLFVHDYQTLIRLVYPFGPLAFLRIPTYEGANFIIFMIFIFFLKVGFVLLGFRVSKIDDVKRIGDDGFTRWFVPAVFLTIASYFANVDLLIVFNCLFLCLITLQERKWWPFVMASILSALAIFIKVSIGINAMTIVLISVIIGILFNREVRFTISQLLIILFVWLVSAFAVLHHPATVWHWLTGVFHLVFGYGALSLTYNNKVFCLVLFLTTTLTMMCIVSSKSAKYASMMLAIPLFAFWKHAIMREDVFHYFGLVNFIVVLWMIIALLEERRKALVLLLGSVSILSLMLNASDMELYHYKNNKEFCGVANFTNPYFHYHKYVKNAQDYTEWLLLQRQLPDSMRQAIGESTIDIYPYEFSYAAQNKLNWQPRVALGSALSRELETRSTKNFSSGEEAAQFVLMHFEDDPYGGHSVSIDNHYFMNDEPELIRNLLSHYRLAMHTDQLLLLVHTGKEALGKPKMGKPFTVRWDDWVEVPTADHAVVRLKVQSRKSFWGKIKSAFYKEGYYFVEYQTDDGNVYSYRYNPVFAEEGLWCAPFVRFPSDTVSEPRVVRVRLLTDDKKSRKTDLRMSFEVIPIQEGVDLFLNNAKANSQLKK